MKTKTKTLLIPVVLFAYSCSSAPTMIVKEVSLANESVMGFWDDWTPGCSAYYKGIGESYYPEPFVYEYEPNPSIKRRELNISSNEDMSDATTYPSAKASLSIPDLFMGKEYYVRADYYDENDNLVKGQVEKYITKQYPRTIAISGVSNTRDFGGYSTEDGHRIAQGKVYRGANLDGITEKGLTQLIDDYGIKTDLDLRKVDEGSAATPSLNYINKPGVAYVEGSLGIKALGNQEALKEEIEVFANEDNYPIYFHCAIGRDRTGTLAIILGALLGVSMETLIKEYELSFFSTAGNADGVSASDMVANATSIFSYVNMRSEVEDAATLKDVFEHWLINDIDVAPETIAKIREIMIE